MPDTPPTRKPGPDTPFEIGLVMAGAISAGAYTAGVIDFLLEALDEWEKAKRFAREHPDDPKSQECPMHEVKIRALAGASAGGMSAALTAGLIGMNFESVPSLPAEGQEFTPANNNLYRSWVNTIDIDPLLGVKDLDADGDLPVQSVLDSSILQDIASNAFRFEKPDDRLRRSYVADPLHVLVTVTNLRGVPYAPSFENWAKMQQYEMMMHADNMHFVVSQNQPPDDDGAFWLKPYDFGNRDTWGVLQTAALATGAFPVGLAPRLLKRLPSQYQYRQWTIPGPHEQNGVHYCSYWKAIPPDWPAIDECAAEGKKTGKPYQYEFLCVDGGVMNNEPLDLARRVLAGPDGPESVEGDKATRAVIMVMPFPNAAPYPTEYDGRMNLFNLLFTTFNCLIRQARFKPDELALANDPKVYSRFLVVPRRGFREDRTLEPYAIACGSLEGFGGFLSRKFREHDYQLGRRNCQWFLMKYFALPSDPESGNKLFENWTPAARRAHRIVKSREGGAKSPPRPQVALEAVANSEADVLPFLPIIPVMGRAAESIPLPEWPSFSEAEFAALGPKIRNRVKRVVLALIDQNVEGSIWKGNMWAWLTRGALKSALWFKGRSAVDYVTNAIRDDLTKRGLMAPK